MKYITLILCLVGLISCQNDKSSIQAFGSFYVDNPFDTTANDIQSVVDTLYSEIGDSTSLGSMISAGTGSPEGVVSARIGALYLRLDAGGSDSALYVKRYYSLTDTGWIAK